MYKKLTITFRNEETKELEQEAFTLFTSQLGVALCDSYGWEITGKNLVECIKKLAENLNGLFTIETVDGKDFDIERGCCYGEYNADLLLTGSDY